MDHRFKCKRQSYKEDNEGETLGDHKYSKDFLDTTPKVKP